MHKNKT